MSFRILVNLIQFLGFSSRATTSKAPEASPPAGHPEARHFCDRLQIWSVAIFATDLNSGRSQNLPQGKHTPLGFSSRATTANHRTPSSYYLIIPAEQPRSSEEISMGGDLWEGLSCRGTTGNHRTHGAQLPPYYRNSSRRAPVTLGKN